ncbi:MAG: hypothetical protein EPO68_14935 [Planctomycetota bacterium]|nr:MAG: hypothetical protein EPO68_14935 [Planctomycetota bacterium]
MSGSLAARGRTLYVAWPGCPARWRAFEVSGRALTPWMALEAGAAGRAGCAGLDVDADHRLWIADPEHALVRCVNLFGAQLAALRAWPSAPRDGLGTLSEPLGLACAGDGDPLRLWLAQGGVRRAAVQLLDESGRARARLRSLGDPREPFRGARRVRAAGRYVWVLEALARRVQVFRDGEFHFAFQVRERGAVAGLASVAVFDDGSGVACTAGDAARLLRIGRSGNVRGVLCEDVEAPSDVALLDGFDPHGARIALLDRDGLRVRAFEAAGRCVGAIDELVG